MGVVGLSFGSPTSGSGFDVSSTVASIVSNLQAVETPWKNQLTSLKSQDTAISNLGTLMSNLSNDMSSLTEFTGIMSQKTGSSSNTNVLELTAASATAVAGTHAVTVSSLAKTSSGYLTAISNSSDTLSGSITLKVGSGTAKTITVGSSSNTLASLAKAINSSGAGVTASVLTDSSGSRLSLVSGTSGAGGNLTITSSIVDASNSNAALSYNSTVTGADAALNVDGVNLTSASNTVTGLIPGLTFQLLSASSTQSDGSLAPVQVVIGNDITSAASVIESLVSDYNSLISAVNTQEGNDSSGNAQPLYGSPTLSLLQQQLLGGLNAQNPNGYLDTIKNASDTLSGSITIQAGSGTAQTFTVDSSNNTLAGLAASINAAGIGVTAKVTTDKTGSRLDLVSQTTGSAGALTVTTSLTDATTSTSLGYNSSDSSITDLTALGIGVNNDGTISLTVSTMSSMLNSDFSSVVGFFQSSDSWGMKFSNMLTATGTSSSSGILSLASKSNSSMESTLNANITKEESMISIQQKSLTAELNSANEIMQMLPTQLQGVNELYSAVTGYNTYRG